MPKGLNKIELNSGDVKSAARTLDILMVLAEFPEGLSLTEIEKNMGFPLSSLHGLLNTMVNRGFATKNPNTNIYRLGPRLMQIASSYRSHSNLVSIVDPIMQRLKQLTSETVSLTVLQGDVVLFVHKHPAEGRVQIVNPVGTKIYAHATGSGKIMLAYLSREELNRIYPNEELPTQTKNTIRTKTELITELAEVRQREYAYDDQESEEGLWAVASCILGQNGDPVAALSVVAPVFRLQGKDYKKWHTYLIEAAHEASIQLKFIT